MRRFFLAACLCCVALAAGAQSPPVVDLDQPGALARLKAEQPEHYAKIVKRMDEIQAVPYTDKARHDLRLEVRKPDPTRRQIETSLPAKTRMTMPIDDVVYKITVVYTKHPATTVPAK